MLTAIIFASGLLALLIGGKTLLTVFTMLPVIGSAIGRYADLAASVMVPGGITEQLIYGGMAVQVVVMLLSVPLYLPGLIHRGVIAFRARIAARS